MDENKVTVVTKPAQTQDEVEIDLLDLLAALLLKWKLVLALLLVGAIVGYGGAYVKNANSKTEPVEIEKAVEDARGQLSEDQAAAVEQLTLQYANYLNLQKEMRAYYSGFVDNDMTVDNTVQMRSEYYIVSDIQDLDTVFIKMAVTEADYQAMREIAPDEKAGAPIYDRVLFTTAYHEKPDNMKNNTIDNTINNTIKVPAQNGEKNAYLINVELYGNSEQQCREMTAVIDAAFRREAEELKVLDPDLQLESLGQQLNNNVADYVQSLHKKNLDRMTVSETELNNLTTKIGKFTSEEKEYYNLLLKQYQGASSVAGKHVSEKKWTAIGAFLGVVLACCAVFFPYLTDGTVKTANELQRYASVLSRVSVKGEKNLFGRWAAKLRHADGTDPTLKADILATAISIMMEKNGKKALMLLCGEGDADAAALAEQVKAKLLAKNSELKVSIGNPIHSADELETAAQAEMSVAFAEMKKSKRAVLREWRQICACCKLPLAGTVAVQRCW